MDPLKSNLGKICRHCGLKTTVVILAKLFVIHLIFVGNMTITTAKSVKDLSSVSPLLSVLNDDIDDLPEQTSKRTSSMAPKDPETEILLDMIKDPEVIFEMWSNATSHKFVIGKNETKDWRIAVHLKECDFDTDDFIELTDLYNGHTEKWYCSQKTITYAFYAFLEEYAHHDLAAKTTYSRGKRVQAKEFVDNLREVRIVPHLNHTSGFGSTGKKATVIINIYKDVPGSNACGENLFDCRQSLCTCCDDPPQKSSTSRCIPIALRCNDQPNCGMKENADEKTEICHSEKACQCQTVCLAWNYVLTSLAIAILFIITPTAIVFALFHRRNVALERARLLRLAQIRMAEMRSNFTREDPLNDHPPSYDEVYDIKEPPPCFCQAIAMQSAQDYQMTEQNRENDSQEQTQLPNSRLECSCARGATIEHDIPPSYSEVNIESNDHDNRERNKDFPTTPQNIIIIPHLEHEHTTQQENAVTE